MSKIPAHIFSPEKLSSMSKAEVETVRQNAIKKNANDLIGMCDASLAARIPPKKKKSSSSIGVHGSDEFVEGYHFVCKNARGVTEDATGKFRTGSWVVGESNVQKSLRYGAYIALHESRLDASYRQGKLLDYCRTSRDMLADKPDSENKVEEGIEFLVQETGQSYSWVGEATGEKGYKWSKVSLTMPLSHEGEKQP